MKFIPILSIALMLLLSSCTDCSYQYDLWVKNDSSQNIIIETKNAQLRDNNGSAYTDLAPGDYKKIWSSKDISVGNCKGLDKSHCSLITEHVRIKRKSGQTSNLMWCEDYKLEWVDIQQGEFSAVVTDADF